MPACKRCAEAGDLGKVCPHFTETDAYKALIAESTRLRAAATEYHATKSILIDWGTFEVIEET